MTIENLIPKVAVITDVRKDTPDVKTFRVVGLDGKKLFEHLPGQCAMVSVPGVSEAMFSITSSPTNKEFMEFSIKKCGCLTEILHSLEVGNKITVRTLDLNCDFENIAAQLDSIARKHFDLK